MHLRTEAVSAYSFFLADPARGNGHANCIHDVVVVATDADRSHSNLGGNLVVILSLRSGHATEQAINSGGTLATTQSVHDPAEKP